MSWVVKNTKLPTNNSVPQTGGRWVVATKKSQNRRPITQQPTIPPKTIQQPRVGVSGLIKNAGTDLGYFAKGLLGIGRQAIFHPIDTSKKIAGMGGEVVKGAPGAVKDLTQLITNYKETQRKGIEGWRQLKQIPLEQQREMLSRDVQAIGESEEAKVNPNKRRLAQMGLSILGNYSQYSRPGEKIYKEPFSFALDVFSPAKALGITKATGKVVSGLNKIPAVAKTTEKISDAFVPLGKLKRLGYGDVAEDVSKTSSNIRKSQEGIIRATVKKFEKEFKLSKSEKTEFFETIDKGRRTPGYIPKSANPKVQKAIDWYMKEELPKIRKMAGYTLQEGVNPLIQEARKGDIAYHGTQAKEIRGIPNTTQGKMGNAFYLTSDENKALRFGKEKNIKEEIITASGKKVTRTLREPDYYPNSNVYSFNIGNAKIKPITDEEFFRLVGNDKPEDYFRLAGYDGVFNKDTGTYAIYNPEKLKLSQPLQEGVSAAGKEAPIENYLHHFFNPTNETKFGGKLSSPQRGFLKQSKDVEGFVKDPVVSIAGVKSKAATANIKQGFIDRVIKKYGIDKATEFKNGKAFTETGEEVSKYKGKYLPKDLADELTRIEKGEPGWLKTVLAPARAFNRNWKPLATAVRPRYHLRNIIGNLYNASFVGGGKLRRYPEALFQQVKGHIATQMKEGTIAGKFYKAIFKQAPEHKFIKMATEDDVVGKGFFSVDINDMAEIADTVEDFSKLIAKADSPALVYKIPLLKQWMEAMQTFGSAVEDNARLALYIDQLKKGATRVAAKKYVDKHLFDYMNGLGEADKIIKAIIPFWSWTRFNVPLQFGSLAKNPLRHLLVQEGGKPWVQQQEAENPEYQYLPQREKDMGAVKIGEEQNNGKIYDKYMRTQSVLPIQDLAKFADPDNMGVSPLFNMLNQARYMVSPPDNSQNNLDYFGRPVEQYAGESKRYLGLPVRGTTKEILQSIPFINEINKGIGGSYTDENRPSIKSRMETVLSPTSSTIIDRDKQREYAESDYNTMVKGDYAPGLESNFKYTIKQLLNNPQDRVLSKNKNTLVELLRQQNYTDEDIEALVKKAIKNLLEDKKIPPEKRKNLILKPELADEILKKTSNLNPYYK